MGVQGQMGQRGSELLLSHGHPKPMTFKCLRLELGQTIYRQGEDDFNHFTNLQIAMCTWKKLGDLEEVTEPGWRRAGQSPDLLTPCRGEGQHQDYKHFLVDGCPGLSTSRTAITKSWDAARSALLYLRAFLVGTFMWWASATAPAQLLWNPMPVPHSVLHQWLHPLWPRSTSHPCTDLTLLRQLLLS